MIGRNDPCWCGSGQKWKKCHAPELPIKNIKADAWKNFKIIVKTPEEIEGIRRSCKLAAHILNETCKRAVAGVTTLELDAFAAKLHKEAGATCAPFGYGDPPFPKNICTSLNDVICHGIPDETVLKEGDILNIDITCILDGFYGDCSKMVIIGDASPEKKRVVAVSYECLKRAIAAVKPGGIVADIGNAIEPYALSQGCSVVHQFVGHGVGVQFHEAPQIPHFKNRNQTPLFPGMTFTIEPMINAGSPNAVIDPEDDWTARTPDGLPSAQWEHTLLVTETGVEILTPWE